MFDPYRKWLGIPTKDQPPHHYRLLSLELFEPDPDVIEGAADRVMGFLRQYQSGEHSAAAAKLLNEVAVARLCLLKVSSKEEYDRKLRKRLANSNADNLVTAEATRDTDLDETDLTFPRRKKVSKKNSPPRPASNSAWISIALVAGVVIVAAFFLLKPSGDRPTDSNQAATASANPAPTVPSSGEASPSSTETIGKSETISGSTPVASVPAEPAEKPSPSKAGRSSNAAILRRVDMVKFDDASPYKVCRTPTLLETPKGLIVVFTARAGEQTGGFSLWFSRFERDEWTSPVKLVDGLPKDGTTRFDCATPTLFQYPDKKILLFYRHNLGGGNWKCMQAMSVDGSATWLNSTEMPPGINGPTKSRPQFLADGSLLCGSSQEKGAWTIHFERLNSDGRTWTKTEDVKSEKLIEAIEPMLLPHPNRRWQALCRPRTERKIVESWSEDDGRTWSPLSLTDLPNPGSSLDAIRLKDGRFLVAYNHSQTERTPLNIAISEDGKQWQAAMSLEVDKEVSTSPSIVQTGDGLVHIGYSRATRDIRHVTVDLQNISLKPIVDGEWPKH